MLLYFIPLVSVVLCRVFPVGCVHSPLCSGLCWVLLTDCEQSNSADSTKTLDFQGCSFMKRGVRVALFKHNTSSCQASVRPLKSWLSAPSRFQTWQFTQPYWNSSPKTDPFSFFAWNISINDTLLFLDIISFSEKGPSVKSVNSIHSTNYFSCMSAVDEEWPDAFGITHLNSQIFGWTMIHN